MKLLMVNLMYFTEQAINIKHLNSKILVLISLFLISSFSACEKEYEPTGRFGFVFKVDGEFLKAESRDWKKSAVNAGVKGDTLAVSGKNSMGSNYHSAGFRIVDFSGPGTYNLNSGSVNYGSYNRTYTDANHTGELVVTHYLPEKGIIAGTFSFTSLDSNTGKTYEITDGKFDIFYTIY